MTDRFRIDSHKLVYHVRRVADWMDNKMIYPIYMEISPGGSCNHRCVFCSVDFMGYRKRFIDSAVLMKRISEFADLGVKSIMFAGEGEPLLHKDLPEIMIHSQECGIDVALTTNGVLMHPSVTDRILGVTEWIKVSVDAGTPETYARIHGTNKRDFSTVLSNIEYAVEKRKQTGSRCAIGLQILLLPENYKEVEQLADTARQMGADYIVVKPYTHHEKNVHDLKIEYSRFDDLDRKLQKYNTEGFHVIFRKKAMNRWDSKIHGPSKCICLPFWSYIDSAGGVWGCSAHLTDERFYYGSLLENGFQEIWEGEKRKQSLESVQANFDTRKCKLNCRMGAINNYLNELKTPPDHVNFI